MKTKLLAATAILAISAGALAVYGQMQPGRSLQTPALDVTLRESFDMPAADENAAGIVAADEAFLATLSTEERALAVYDFADNTQRSNWSNFPTGPVQRGGVMRGNLTDAQNSAMDDLLAVVLSAEGMNNTRYQLAGEDALGGGGLGGAQFGSEYFFMSFLGEPSTDAPWMLQFGGHHLAYNVTFFGAEASYSPMLTGGEPLKINYDGQDIFVTEKELTAAAAFMASLDDSQKETVIRGSDALNLLSGPGEFGTVIAPEGIKGSNLTAEQQALLLAVIEARLGFINADDFAEHMATIRAEIGETYFGWWGPETPLGSGYFRVTGPSILMEYSPQAMDGDPTDHAHNMYRNPANDYGAAWIVVK